MSLHSAFFRSHLIHWLFHIPAVNTVFLKHPHEKEDDPERDILAIGDWLFGKNRVCLPITKLIGDKGGLSLTAFL